VVSVYNQHKSQKYFAAVEKPAETHISKWLASNMVRGLRIRRI
jgi:hypothetical protein